MKERRTYTINNLPSDKTNWAKVAKFSDKKINAAAKTDQDAKPLTKAQLTKFKRVHTIPPKEIKDIREKLNLTQEVFSAYFGVNIRTLQEWEQGRRKPDGAACTLLLVIKNNPKAVRQALFL